MSKQFMILLGLGIAVAALGCDDAPKPGPGPTAVNGPTEPDANTEPVAAIEPDREVESPDDGVATSDPQPEIAATASEHKTDESAPSEDPEPVAASDLELEGIRFIVPAGWKKVKPQTNIVEAEFELPRVEGDEYDGRLTLMSSGGDPQDVIANRTAEFIREPGSGLKVEPFPIGHIHATWVDLQGEWKGPAFRPVEPRADYRMVLVIIPFTERSAFYAKLTGPRETVTAREEEFRAFVHSAEITMP